MRIRIEKKESCMCFSEIKKRIMKQKKILPSFLFFPLLCLPTLGFGEANGLPLLISIRQTARTTADNATKTFTDVIFDFSQLNSTHTEIWDL
jgi:hypothetical protein